MLLRSAAEQKHAVRRNQGIEGSSASLYPARRPPLAAIAPKGQVLRIVHVDRAAAIAGIRPGQTLAEAKSIVPELVTFDDDPHADRHQLESLAVLAGNLAPTVHLEDADTLIVDATGCHRLYGTEEAMLHRAVVLFRGERFQVRVAMADTPGAAWALAHAHPESPAIAEPEQTAAALAPLPVESLRIDKRAVAKLHTVGVETIGALLHLPRSSLTSRFGETLLQRMDQALGDQLEVLRPYRPQTALTARFALGMPTDRLDAIIEAVERTLATFCDRLEKRVAGVRQIFVTFYCPDVVTEDKTESRTVTVEVSLSEATRSAKHLLSLLHVRLEALALPGPADTVMIWSRVLERLDVWQTELFDTGANDPHELGALLDRLAVRLTPAAVVRAEPVSDHQPERAFRYVTLVGSDGGKGSRGRDRGTKGRRDKGGNSDGATKRRSDGGWHGETRLPVQLDDRVESTPNADPVVRTADPTPTSCHCSVSSANDVNVQIAGIPAHWDARCDYDQEPTPGADPVVRTADPTSTANATDLGARPLRLLYNPIEIHATALAPEGPPISFRLSGVSHRVADCVGPERIETGWWRGPHVQRDYYRVRTESGRRAWIFRRRDTSKWFLHGWFD